MEQHGVYQDMDAPLSHYYALAWPHPYLHRRADGRGSGRLVASSSALAGALLSGCRYVQLPVFDDDGGSGTARWLPTRRRSGFRVRHPHLPTGSLSLTECLQIIVRTAFVISPYPIMLGLEDHCSPERKEALALCLRHALGDTLHIPMGQPSHLDSPQKLRGRIVICYSDKHSAVPTGDGDGGAHAEAVGAFQQLLFLAISGPAQMAKARLSRHVLGTQCTCEELADAAQASDMTLEKHTQRHMVVVCNDSGGGGSKGLAAANVDPNAAVELLHKGVQVHLTGGAREPGAHDEAAWAREAFFHDNGGCGYVRKPESLLGSIPQSYDSGNGGPVPLPPSLQRLSKLPLKLVLERLQLSPALQRVAPAGVFVEVAVFGMPADNRRQRTWGVTDSLGDYEFDFEFEFQLSSPSTTAAVVMVRADTPERPVLLYHALPCNNLPTGKATLPLLSLQHQAVTGCAAVFTMTLHRWPLSDPDNGDDGAILTAHHETRPRGRFGTTSSLLNRSYTRLQRINSSSPESLPEDKLNKSVRFIDAPIIVELPAEGSNSEDSGEEREVAAVAGKAPQGVVPKPSVDNVKPGVAMPKRNARYDRQVRVTGTRAPPTTRPKPNLNQGSRINARGTSDGINSSSSSSRSSSSNRRKQARTRTRTPSSTVV